MNYRKPWRVSASVPHVAEPEVVEVLIYTQIYIVFKSPGNPPAPAHQYMLGPPQPGADRPALAEQHHVCSLTASSPLTTTSHLLPMARRMWWSGRWSLCQYVLLSRQRPCLTSLKLPSHHTLESFHS